MPFRDKFFPIDFACFQCLLYLLLLQPVVIYNTYIRLKVDFRFLTIAHHVDVNWLVFIQVEIKSNPEYR